MLIASWNVNSISVRLNHLLNWLDTVKPDIVCIQETKSTDEKFPEKAISEANYYVYYTGEKSYNGVAILSRQKADFVKYRFSGDDDTSPKRYLEASFGDVHVINVYIPNGSEVGSEKYLFKLNWISTLVDELEKDHKEEQKIVICGDFNVAPEDIDVYDPKSMGGQILVSDQERQSIAKLKAFGFVDVFRMHNQEEKQFTWWDYRLNAFRRNMGFRIDHIWATKPLAELSTNSWIDCSPRKLERPSDHTPILAEFNM